MDDDESDGRVGTEPGLELAGPTGAGRDHVRASQSLSTELVALAREQYHVIRGADAQTYAVAKSNPGIAIALRGSRDGLRQQLAAAYFDQRGRAATAVALADMLNVVEGDALRADPVPVDLRVATRDGALYIDRATPKAAAIRVTPTGWDVTGNPPVIFRRTALSAPLPEPARGGSLGSFRDLLNVDDAGFRLLIGWLLAAYLPGIPHPILALLGQQGTAKTTALRLLLSLLDPSTAPVRTPPTDAAAWAVTAAHSWAVGLDNVSALAPWLQDALCKAVTGDGIVRRALYSDNDVSVLAFRRVLALTSIDPGSLQGDVADRMLTVELDPIRKDQRRTDRAVFAAFDRDLGRDPRRRPRPPRRRSRRPACRAPGRAPADGRLRPRPGRPRHRHRVDHPARLPPHRRGHRDERHRGRRVHQRRPRPGRT